MAERSQLAGNNSLAPAILCLALLTPGDPHRCIIAAKWAANRRECQCLGGCLGCCWVLVFRAPRAGYAFFVRTTMIHPMRTLEPTDAGSPQPLLHSMWDSIIPANSWPCSDLPCGSALATAHGSSRCLAKRAFDLRGFEPPIFGLWGQCSATRQPKATRGW
jgi:hypothetical protein